ncbi:hypothetical protein LINPERPRIM_LOCUS41327 [Linum perenne]
MKRSTIILPVAVFRRFIIDEEINDHPSCRRIPPIAELSSSRSQYQRPFPRLPRKMTTSRSSPARPRKVQPRSPMPLRLQSCKQYGVDWTSWWKVNSRAFSSDDCRGKPNLMPLHNSAPGGGFFIDLEVLIHVYQECLV